MFCTNCGNKLSKDANYCINCGRQVPQNSSTQSNTNNLGSLSRNIKKEVSSLPVISIISDSIQGASGLHILQEEIRKNPEKSVNWLFYYEAFITYLRMKNGLGIARLIFNPIGYVVSRGVASGLNVLDDEYKQFVPQKCLTTCIAIVMKKIKEKQSTTEDSLVVGRALFYLAINESNDKKRLKMLESSAKYLSLAIEIVPENHYKAEFFFYLGQTYQQTGNKELMIKSFNISRRMGFLPAVEVLKTELLRHGTVNEQEFNSLIRYDNLVLDSFHFTYLTKMEDRVGQSFEYVITEQSKKFVEATKKIKNLWRL